MADDPRVEAAARVLLAHIGGAFDPDVRVDRCVDAAEDVLAAADRAAWRDISEARDGSPVLVRHPGIYHGIPFTVRWAPSELRPAEPWIDVVHKNKFRDGILTHFQSLPALPEDSEEQEQQP